MDKHLAVRRRFEQAGQLTAFERMKAHKQQRRLRSEAPQSNAPRQALLAYVQRHSACAEHLSSLRQRPHIAAYVACCHHLGATGAARVLESSGACRVLAEAATLCRQHQQDPATFRVRGKGVERILRSLLHHLFGPYDLPDWIWHRIWKNGDSSLMPVMAHLMAGKSLRTLPNPILPFSRRMVHDFLAAPVGCTYVGAYRWAQVRRAGGRPMLHTALIRTHLAEVTDDEAFWDGLIRYLSSRPEFPMSRLPLVMQYLWYRRYGVHIRERYATMLPMGKENQHFKYQHMSGSALVDAALRHHEELKKAYERSAMQWKPMMNPPRQVLVHPATQEEWEVVELHTAQELKEEGQKMRHCVGGYRRPCAHGKSAIFSFRLQGRPRATLEVLRGELRIVQFRGFANAPPHQDTRVILHLWAPKMMVTLTPGQ